MPLRDYHDWHDDYDRPGSPLHRRLEVVIELLGHALDRLPPGPVRVVSLCAGQGADVLAVARQHPRGRDLVGRLVELDPRNVAIARRQIDEGGFDNLAVSEADAGQSDAYLGAAPADLVVACGIFGNVSDDDIAQTIRFLPSLCAPGAHVVWTRHPRDASVIQRIEGWLAEAGFTADALVIPDDGAFGVGAAHLTGEPRPLVPGVRLFEFLR
jgi:SAM-dependent methyltransferase